MGRLEGKVAIITGGGAGIGEASASAMAREGAAVAVADMNGEAGEAVVKKITEEGGKAKFWHLNVTDEAAVKQVFKEVVDTFGSLTVLMNNAGIAGANKPTDQLTTAEFDAVMNVNCRAVFICTREAIPYMRKAGKGSIINLSSVYGLVGAADVPGYHASKGAVRLMTKNDALFYAKENIRVNSLHPGFIATPMVQACNAQAALDALAAKHPVGHLGEPMDIAMGAVFLASDETKFMTGSELVIDGGYTAQ